jgi:hypothetical protein
MSGTGKVMVGVAVLVVVGATVALGVARSGERPVEVRVEEVRERELVATITATGSIRARRQVNISSDVMGRVIQLNVEEGDQVRGATSSSASIPPSSRPPCPGPGPPWPRPRPRSPSSGRASSRPTGRRTASGTSGPGTRTW